MQNKLFKKSSVERFSSPEKLNDYIQVATPSSWMVLAAALVLLAGVLVWGIFGEMTTSVSFSGVAREGVLRCYVSGESADALAAGMQASIVPVSGGAKNGAFAGNILSVAEQPLSYMEASAGMESDYLLDALGLSSWNIAVEIEAGQPLYEGIVYQVSVVTDTFRPIELVFE